MAAVRAYAYQWKSDSASSFGGRTFARALLRRFDEVAFVVSYASGRRIDCALSGREKRAWSIMAPSGALCGGLFLYNRVSSWSDRGRVRSRRRMARVLLFQFSAQHSAASKS